VISENDFNQSPQQEGEEDEPRPLVRAFCFSYEEPTQFSKTRPDKAGFLFLREHTMNSSSAIAVFDSKKKQSKKPDRPSG
jgi:hypothetical protein